MDAKKKKLGRDYINLIEQQWCIVLFWKCDLLLVTFTMNRYRYFLCRAPITDMLPIMATPLNNIAFWPMERRPKDSLSLKNYHCQNFTFIWISHLKKIMLKIWLSQFQGNLRQEAQRAAYRAPEYNVPPFWQISQDGNFCLLIGL